MALAPCGTAAAYWRHLHRGEPTDPACRAAATAYRQAPMNSECWCCGRTGVPHGARGLCARCYHRWARRGFTGAGPGPEFTPQADRAREYAHIITVLSARQAAQKLGVSARTVVRWRAALKATS